MTPSFLVSAAQLIPNVPGWLKENVGEVPDKLKKVTAKRLFGLSKADLMTDYELDGPDASTLLDALWPYRGIPPSDQLQRYAN